MSDTWTIREKLYLASAVAKSGENNWATVCKLMRNISDNDRPPDFFSQKNCAQQFTSLVDTFALPRRKRTDTAPSSTEPAMSANQVVEKLNQLRVEELNRVIQQERAQFSKLKKEIEMIRSGQFDHQIPIMLEQRLGKCAAASAAPKPRVREEIPQVPPIDFPANVMASPGKLPDQDVVEVATSPKIPSSPKVSSSPKIPSTPKASEIPESVGAILSPSRVEMETKSPIISSPRTPSNSTLFSASEFVSPSKTPSLLVVKPTSPLMSPSMSPSGPATAIQGALLSPTTSVSRSPPRQVENQALDQLNLQSPPPAPAPVVPTTPETITTPASIKDISEITPVVELEQLTPSRMPPAIEESDSEDEQKPLAKLKTPPISTTPAKTSEAPTPTAAEPVESPVKEEPVVPPQPKLEPLKIRMDTIEKQPREKETPPKRIMPVRGKAAAASQRRKRNSGGSTTSSDASSTIRPSAVPPGSSRSPLPVPGPFPDNETYKQWKKMVLNAWEQASGHRHASLFLQPVKDSIAPGYSKIVKKPTDLSAIKRNIENGTLTTIEEVRRDFLLMFANAVMYNASNTEVNQMAREMADDVLRLLDDLHISINAMFSGGGVEATKSLRSNRQRQTPAATPTPDVMSRRSQMKRPRINSEEETAEKPTTKRQK